MVIAFLGSWAAAAAAAASKAAAAVPFLEPEPFLRDLLVNEPMLSPLARFNDASRDGVLIVSIGTLSFSHVNVNGKSPVATTHCMLVRSPTFKSRAKLKGVILGGTEKTTTEKQKVWHSVPKQHLFV